MSWLKSEILLTLDTFVLNTTLNLPKANLTVITGKSGAGKTTLLHCLAGLTKINAGFIMLDNIILQNSQKNYFVPTRNRNIGLVFQQPYLFTHLTVLQNIAYGFKRTIVGNRKITCKQVSKMLGLQSLLQRNVTELSGGEQQRVAIARALAANPKLLLLDEPVTALDNNSKQQVLNYLKTIQYELQLGIILVSHELKNITAIADNILTMQQGTISY